jgi:general secretion pathway protein M
MNIKLPPAWQEYWRLLGSREKRLVLGAAAVVAVALLWWIALAPALRVLHAAGTQHALLDSQLQQMQMLANQAQALQSQPAMNADEALRALELSIRQKLGATTQFTVTGERVTVTLKSVSADALAQWLTQARVNARARPVEARLTRTAAGWEGTLVLNLAAARS